VVDGLKGEQVVNHFYGIYRGTVINNVDPEGRGRIIAHVAAVHGNAASSWAKPMRTPAIPLVVPAPGDPVWVLYEGGDTRLPVWIGLGPVSAVSSAIPHDSADVMSLSTVQTATGRKTFSAGISAGASTFTGALTATSATFSGAVTATTGSFSGTVTVPTNNWSIANTSGLQAALDSKYGFANPPPAPGQPGGGPVPGNMATTDTAQTISGAKTFTAATTSVSGDIALTGTLTSGIVPWARLSGVPAYALQTAVDSINAQLPSFATNVALAGANSNISTLQSQMGSALIVGSVLNLLPTKYSAGNPNLASTVVAATSFGAASVVGTGTAYARNDHTHGTPAAPTPASIGAMATGTGVLKAGDTMTGQLWVNVDNATSGSAGTANALRLGSRTGWFSYNPTVATGNSYWSDNAYYDGTSWRAVATSSGAGQHSFFQMGTGGFAFGNAPGVAAGAAITLTNRFSVDASGNALVGNNLTASGTLTGTSGIYDNGHRVATQGRALGASTVGGSTAVNTTDINSQSLNQNFTTGVYNGSNTTNNPWGDTRWIFLEVFAHENTTLWQRQNVYDMTGGSDVIYTRRGSDNGSGGINWTTWVVLGQGAGMRINQTIRGSASAGTAVTIASVNLANAQLRATMGGSTNGSPMFGNGGAAALASSTSITWGMMYNATGNQSLSYEVTEWI
jgi:hypothetical protein